MKKIVNILVVSGFVMGLVTLMLVLAHSNAMLVTGMATIGLWIAGSIIDDKLTHKTTNK